jgi:transketolase
MIYGIPRQGLADELRQPFPPTWARRQNTTLTQDEITHLEERARFIRLETIRLISIAKVGHYSSAFSAAELLATLYYNTMRIRRDESSWLDRDRFLMGKGHAAVALFRFSRISASSRRRGSTSIRAWAVATAGLMPFVATFASFLALLCCEQIRMDVAYCAQPVRLIGHYAGISLGFYGTSHHATEDLAIMHSIAARP